MSTRGLNTRGGMVAFGLNPIRAPIVVSGCVLRVTSLARGNLSVESTAVSAQSFRANALQSLRSDSDACSVCEIESHQ